MNTGSAQRTILFGMFVALAVGLVRDVRSGRAITSDVSARRLFGTFVGILMLSWLARPAPRVAQGLTWLIVLTQLAGGVPEGLFGDKAPVQPVGFDPTTRVPLRVIDEPDIEALKRATFTNPPTEAVS